ncbi:MAG: recombinase family protein [Proteobacteria bacterium]|nr:recombinase family protein [Pseudomonadota bacterium]
MKPQREPEPQAKTVGVWVRVSTEDQVRGESPEVHEKRARMYAEAREWDVRTVYRLEAVSGKSVMGHPEAQRMLADIRSGTISGLVFSKLARLARNTKELLEFADHFRDAHADMISLNEAIDTGSPAGRFFFTLLSAMAQWEREEIAERIAASVPIRARMGRPIGGVAQFGYQWKDKKLIPDPKEAPVRALMYELFLEHRRARTVARLMNERGYRTRKGTPFNNMTVKRLLLDPTAKGLHRQNYTRARSHGKNWELKPKEDWVETPVEPIVSVEMWEKVNAILENRRTTFNRPSRQSRHLFAGYAYCSCGGKMYVWSANPKYVCKVCRNKIPSADLEAAFRDRLQEFIVSPQEVAAHQGAGDEALREKERLIEAAEAELKKIGAAEDELFDLYHQGQVPKEDFGRRHKPPVREAHTARGRTAEASGVLRCYPHAKALRGRRRDRGGGFGREVGRMHHGSQAAVRGGGLRADNSGKGGDSDESRVLSRGSNKVSHQQRCVRLHPRSQLKLWLSRPWDFLPNRRKGCRGFWTSRGQTLPRCGKALRNPNSWRPYSTFCWPMNRF